VKDLLEMTDKEVEHLVWIHSNKCTTSELFYKKFLSDKSSRTAYNILNRYVAPEKGFLHVLKTAVANSNYFFLTAGALRSLDENKSILVRSTKYPVKINPYERAHDLKVQAIRIVFEASSDLKDIFWVSDFEMRSGITPAIKAEYLEGKLDIERWRSNGANPNPKGRRTPDGYFEADVENRRIGFALEFENQHYSEEVIERMAWNLKGVFPNALKLIVSADPKGAVRMIRFLQEKIKSAEQHQWFVSDFDKVTSMSFRRCWHQLSAESIGGE
jgi:hypothetical protein